MPFTHGWWDDEKTVIHSRIIKPWTWDEYIAELQVIVAMMDEVEHPVISMGDYRQAGDAPSGIVTRLPAVASVLNHPNFHRFVVVGITSALGKSGARIFSSVYGKLDYAATMEEAETIIEQIKREAT